MTLNDTMDFDHIVTVHPDGSVTDGPDNLWVPNLIDEALDDDAWEFASAGYTGQDSYRGPIMHNSEFIGGALERDILASPGVYAAVVAYWSPEGDEAGDEAESTTEGWAVVRLRNV